MNTVVIFAGGTGHRMNSKTLPKQFLELHGKPIIIYTIEQFDKHPLVDGIVVVCLKGWEAYLQKLLKRYFIEKVKAIVPGGETGQDSIYQGLKKLSELYSGDDIVMVHDGVRPLIDEETITANIESVKKNGNAVTVSPCTETITTFSPESPDQINDIIERRNCRIAKAPQSFYLKDILSAHNRARQEGRMDFIDSASMMCHYGSRLYSVEGQVTNIKITTPMDFYIFRAIVDAKEDRQIMGF